MDLSMQEEDETSLKINKKPEKQALINRNFVN